MGKKINAPRKGSLQYWPRKRAKRQHARVRTWKLSEGLLGFAGFKAGMTHVLVTDNRKNSITKGQDISVPVTMVECPPLDIIGVRFYRKSQTRYGEEAATEVRMSAPKHLSRTTVWNATGSLDEINPEEYVRATLIVSTQPKETGIGQKKPQIFELGYGKTVSDVISFAKENKLLSVESALKAGEFYDVHSVTTGRGTQGVIKRFGAGIRSHKSEKSNRKAVLGPEGYGKVSFRSLQGGKMGYHLRTEYNKQIVGIVPADQVQISGGLVNYGQVKNTVLLVKGSIGGTKKRLITFSAPQRKSAKVSTEPMAITYISTRSQQGGQ